MDFKATFAGRHSQCAAKGVSFPGIRWLLFVPALVLTSALPLTIHVLMLNAGIPHPGPVSRTGLIAWTGDFFTACGTLILFQRIGPGLLQRPAIVRAIVIIVLVAGMTGHVFRDFVMNIIDTVAPVISLSTADYLLDNLLEILPLSLIMLLSAAMPAAAFPIRGIMRISAAALVISLAVWLTVGCVLDPIIKPTVGWLDAQEGGALEQLPYDARIQIPAYATFLENGLSTIILVALIWDRLHGSSGRRIGAAAAIVFLLIGPVARPLIDGVRGPDHWLAFLGSLQFSLETLALGALAGLTCLICLRQARQPLLRPRSSSN